MVLYEGKSASLGICNGKAFIYQKQNLNFIPTKVNITSSEVERLKIAFESAINEVFIIKNNFSQRLGAEYGHIFRAQMTMLEDEDFYNEIISTIENEKICAEGALKTVFDIYSEAFVSLGEDNYNSQRLADLKDIYSRILRILLNLPDTDLSGVPEGSIIIAEELTPSDTALMNSINVKGIITEKGGVTSHVAILSKSLGIPASVGVQGIISNVSPIDDIILDTRDFNKALIWINPDKLRKEKLFQEINDYKNKALLISTMKEKEAITLDGKKIELSANIGSMNDLEYALLQGAKSVGLLRTEFFFLKTTKLPDEEKQFQFYKTVAKKLNPGMLVIRTLDIGGDKDVKCFKLPKEDNPFLGLRGIRVCAKHRDIFETQLRAIIRASAFGKIKIMFPMIADVSEFSFAKNLINEIFRKLDSEKIAYDSNIEIGTMIETPAAVFLSDHLTQNGDFISIGTNDLTQYLLCADRTNENVSSYYKMFSPALFRAIKVAVDAAHENGKPAGICGELGGVPIAIPLLIGLGIDELSMSAQMLPEAVTIIRNLKFSDCKYAANKVLSIKTDEEILDFIQSFFLKSGEIE